MLLVIHLFIKFISDNCFQMYYICIPATIVCHLHDKYIRNSKASLFFAVLCNVGVVASLSLMLFLSSSQQTTLICLTNQCHYCQPRTRESLTCLKNYYNWIFLHFFFSLKLTIGNTLYHVFHMLGILCWSPALCFSFSLHD